MLDKAFKNGEIRVTSTISQDDDDERIKCPYTHPSKLFTIKNNGEWIVSMLFNKSFQTGALGT